VKYAAEFKIENHVDKLIKLYELFISK